MRSGRTYGLFDALFVVGHGRFNHDYPAHAIALLQLALQLQMQPLGAHHGDLDHAFLQRTLQGAADERLREVELSRYLRLLQAFLVVEAGNLGDQTQFFDLAHDSLDDGFLHEQTVYSPGIITNTLCRSAASSQDMIKPPSILIAWPVR